MTIVGGALCFAVGHDRQAGTFLLIDGEAYGVALRLVQDLGVGPPPTRVERAHSLMASKPMRLGVAPDDLGRKGT
jgi:hypothetical protein